METAVPLPRQDLFGYVANADIIVQLVLALLLLMSAVCWAIIAVKYFAVRGAQKESLRFLDLFWNSRSMETVFEASEKGRPSPLSSIFRAGYVELVKVLNKRETAGNKKKNSEARSLSPLEAGGGLENVSRSLKRAQTHELTMLQSLLPFLATTGSTAPFIGLFGTVWGIMNTFMNIHAKGATNIGVVAPGIAEALIATAVGLFAAIPAVVFYNFFVTRVRQISSSMENFSADFLNIVKRNFFSE